MRLDCDSSTPIQVFVMVHVAAKGVPARLAILLSLLLTPCAMAQTAPQTVVKQLAPSGTLRAAINFGNSVLAQRPKGPGDPQGVSGELARELAKRLGVPISYATFDQAGKVTDALKGGVWDIAFLAIDPVRAAEIDFTAPYVLIEGTYLVPASSPLRAVADVDKEGVRIAANKGSAYDLYLTRTLKHAKLVRLEGSPSPMDVMLRDGLEATAGVRQPLVAYAKANPKVRVMDGRFMAIEQAMATPKGRDQGAAYLKAFVEEMKATGFVAKALAASGQNEATVAPAAAK